MATKSNQPIFEEKHKSAFFLFVVSATAFVLAWGVWNNYRPSLIYSQCADIAQKTSNLSSRANLGDTSFDYDAVFNDCLSKSDFYK